MIRRAGSSNYTMNGGPHQVVYVGAGEGRLPGCRCPIQADAFYTIEEHLRSFGSDPRFRHLISTWEVEKREYVRQLTTVSATFAEYSLHDSSHSEKIIVTIERLLGPDRISLLTPGDAWLILQCAYTHDLGMCVKEAQKHTFLASPQDFKKEIAKPGNKKILREILLEIQTRSENYPITRSHDKKRRAADYWLENLDKLCDSERFRDEVFGKDFSLARYYLDAVVREYFRSEHAKRARDELIERRQRNVERDSVPGHLREAVAQIDFEHCGAPQCILELERRQNGFCSGDFIHPRFVAALLRIGDLMDMETTRFNPYMIDGLAQITKENMAYMLKDLSVSEILVDQRCICVTSSFETKYVRAFLSRHKAGVGSAGIGGDEVRIYISNAIKHMRDWMNFIKQNTEFVWAAWSDIAPEGFPGSIAAPKKLTILLDGKNCEENDMELKYEIDPTRAAQIIEGAGLYSSPLVFLREIIQNAIDATKVQLFRRFRNEIVQKNTDYEMTYGRFLNKYKDELEANAVQVVLELNEDFSNVEVSVTDRGIGITRQRLGDMRYIGSIRGADLEKEKEKIPEWLRPTARFGIGMQSAFLVAERFTIKTNPRESEKGEDMQRWIVFNSTQLGGDITSMDWVAPADDGQESWERELDEEQKVKVRFPHGTQFKIGIDLRSPTDSVRSLVNAHEEDDYKLYRVSLIDALRRASRSLLKDTFMEEIIPISVKIKLLGDEETMQINTVPFGDAKAVFDERHPDIRFFDNRESISPVIYYWYDNDDVQDRFCALYRFTAASRDELCATSLYFRGIRFSKSEQPIQGAVTLPGYNCAVDIISGNANDWLDINRDRVRRDKLDSVYERLSEGVGKFIFGMTELVKTVVEKTKHRKETPAASPLLKTVMQSPAFAKLLLVYAVVKSKVGDNDPVVDYIAKATGGSVETAIIHERSASITFTPEPITQSNRPQARFLDFDENEEGTKITLDENDARIVQARHAATDCPPGAESPNTIVNKAIRNSFSEVRGQKYKKVEAYRKNKVYGTGIVLIYELDDQARFTDMGEISYGIIANNTIDEHEAHGDSGFPIFPAPHPDWFDGAQLLSLEKRPSVNKVLCDSRFARFAFAPFPADCLRSMLSTLKENSGGGKQMIKEFLEKKEWKQYYKQAIDFTRKYGDIPEGASEERIKEKIVAAWGEYADFLAKLL